MSDRFVGCLSQARCCVRCQPGRRDAARGHPLCRRLLSAGERGRRALGKLNVAPEVMEGHCITKVSPIYPQTDGISRRRATVVVRVVIWKSGSVSPVRVVSGDTSLEAEATNAVRLWRYKPFVRDGEPIDVTTDIHVDFDPQKPGGIVTHPHH